MTIEEIRTKASPILQRYGVEYAAVFGSVARGQDTSDSDVDMIVRVGRIPFGIWGVVGLQQDLQKALDRDVDVLLEQSIPPSFAQYIQSDSVGFYERS